MRVGELLKKQWHLLAEVCAWIATVIGSFWRQPPADLVSSQEQLGAFGQFILALALGVLIIPSHWYNNLYHTIWWVFASLILILGTFTAYFWYDSLLVTWTCKYAGERKVIGTFDSLTEHGKAYFKDNSDLPVEKVVWEHAGATEELWDAEIIEWRRRVLSVLYVAFLPLFGAAVICVLQSIYCASRRRR